MPYFCNLPAESGVFDAEPSSSTPGPMALPAGIAATSARRFVASCKIKKAACTILRSEVVEVTAREAFRGSSHAQREPVSAVPYRLFLTSSFYKQLDNRGGGR